MTCTTYLIATRFSWPFSTVSVGMSAEDMKFTWWLVVRLSSNVEPSTALMAVVTF